MIAELLELDNSGIHVAQYLTEFVPKEILEFFYLCCFFHQNPLDIFLQLI